ncbi:hypothetical protein [Gracilibacillus phocaeensis]|nr:hypothetical protein [Gracilibacillus phocaeensis]
MMRKKTFAEEQEYIMKKLASVGIMVEKGLNKPNNGCYSGIVGERCKDH